VPHQHKIKLLAELYSWITVQTEETLVRERRGLFGLSLGEEPAHSTLLIQHNRRQRVQRPTTNIVEKNLGKFSPTGDTFPIPERMTGRPPTTGPCCALLWYRTPRMGFQSSSTPQDEECDCRRRAALAKSLSRAVRKNSVRRRDHAHRGIIGD